MTLDNMGEQSVHQIPAEMMRLLGILVDCPEGATQHQLTRLGVKPSLIFDSVMLGLVRVEQEQGLAYRFHIMPAGVKLQGVQE